MNGLFDAPNALNILTTAESRNTVFHAMFSRPRQRLYSASCCSVQSRRRPLPAEYSLRSGRHTLSHRTQLFRGRQRRLGRLLPRVHLLCREFHSLVFYFLSKERVSTSFVCLDKRRMDIECDLVFRMSTALHTDLTA